MFDVMVEACINYGWVEDGGKERHFFICVQKMHKFARIPCDDEYINGLTINSIDWSLEDGVATPTISIDRITDHSKDEARTVLAHMVADGWKVVDPENYEFDGILP